MGKNYPDPLAQWIERRGLARSDRNLVAFMAVHDDVKVAIDAGYAVKTVWENLQETGRIDLSYKTFFNRSNPVNNSFSVENQYHGEALRATKQQGARCFCILIAAAAELS